MRERLLWLATACALLGAAAPARAQPAIHGLPPDAQAAAWIEADPSVQQARLAEQAAQHAGTAIAAGTHEWSVRLQAQRREIRDAGARSHEWLAQLERPLRVNGKAQLDARLGALERELALARLHEARHEAARDLADLWLDVLDARMQDALWAQQVAVAQANLQTVERRRRAGDASQLDADLAQADLAGVQGQASLAATRLATATDALRVRFPQAGTGIGTLPDPQVLEWDAVRWRERILQESDAVKVAWLLARRAQLVAQRASADRVPDPTVGVFTASEAQRNERIVGVALTIPIGGEHRQERSLQLLREADAAQAAADLQRQRVELEVGRTFTQADSAIRRWRLAQQSAALVDSAARRMQKAYALGEADLQSLLLARRQSVEAQRAQAEARSEAWRGTHRLLVDAHLVWALGAD